MSFAIPTLSDFNALLDSSESVLSDDAVATIMADADIDLDDLPQVIELMCSRAIRPTQVDDLHNAIKIAKRMREETPRV